MRTLLLLLALCGLLYGSAIPAELYAQKRKGYIKSNKRKKKQNKSKADKREEKRSYGDQNQDAADREEVRDVTPKKKKHSDSVYRFGVWGQAFGGLTLAGFGDQDSALRVEDALGPGYQQKNHGTMVGAGANVLLAKRFVLGLSGAYMPFHISGYELQDTSDFRTGHTSQSGYMLGLQAGYAVNNRNGWLLYPYFGFNIGQTNLTVNNYGADAIEFGDQSVESSGFREFSASQMTLELGVSLKFPLDKRGGIMLGADLGGFYGLPSTWENSDGEPVIFQEEELSTGMMGGYLRFTIGGGFFQRDGGPWPPKVEVKDYQKPKEFYKYKKKKKKGKKQVEKSPSTRTEREEEQEQKIEVEVIKLDGEDESEDDKDRKEDQKEEEEQEEDGKKKKKKKK